MQTRRVLDNLAAILAAAGASFEHVVKTTVFLLDMNDFAAMNAVYATYVPTPPPARSTVQVSRLPRDVARRDRRDRDGWPDATRARRTPNSHTPTPKALATPSSQGRARLPLTSREP